MALMLPTVTDKLAAELGDSNKFFCEKALPVIRPHRRFKKDSEGKPTAEVKYEILESDLQGICDRSNESIAQSFHYPRHTIGHTNTTVAEVNQPAKFVGVLKNFQVAQLPNGKKLIVADHYTRTRHVEALEDFPYRSAEYNWKTKKIRGVARILRDPALEMGTTCLSDDDFVELADAMGYDDEGKDEKNGEDKPGQPPQPKTPNDGVPRNPDEKAKLSNRDGWGKIKQQFGDLNPDEVVAAERLINFIKDKYPEASVLFDKATGDVPDQITPPTDGGEGRQAAEAQAAEDEKAKIGQQGQDDQNPESNPADKGKPPFEKKKKPEEDSMSQNSEIDALRLELKKTKVAGIIDRLVSVERLSLDRAEVEIDLLARDEAGQEKYIESLRKHAKVLPGNPTGEAIEVLSDPATLDYLKKNSDPISVSKDKMTREEYLEAMSHLEDEVEDGDTDEERGRKWGQVVRKIRKK